ncbi:hypothetical protein HPC49_37315 [Pyxidicoccus fallax]|nr:hypothetical protein [Pyxidicoccus fallax]
MALLVAGCGGGASGSNDETDAGTGNPNPTDGGTPNNNGACPALTGAKGPGVVHDEGGESLEADTVWKASDSPHIVANAPNIDAFTLTIEPCAVVLLRDDRSITVSGRGKLVARGTADKPILFDSEEPGRQWSSLIAESANGEVGTIDLAHVTLRNGGKQGFLGTENFFGGVVSVTGNDSLNENKPRTPSLRVQNVIIENTPDWGVRLRTGAVFSADSTQLTIRNAIRGSMRVGFRLADTIPSGSYTGNGAGDIVLKRDMDFLKDSMTLRDRGVPYRLNEGEDSDDFIIGASTEGGARTTLTLEPGVRLKMAGPKGLSIEKNGALVARGTAAKPIVFTSAAASPAPGAWEGIAFRGSGRGSVIEHAEVSFAGGTWTSTGPYCDASTGEATYARGHGAISLAAQPESQFITHTRITQSARFGIHRAWSGSPVDFMSTNTFESVAACRQSYPAMEGDTCPATVPCP